MSRFKSFDIVRSIPFSEHDSRDPVGILAQERTHLQSLPPFPEVDPECRALSSDTAESPNTIIARPGEDDTETKGRHLESH